MLRGVLRVVSLCAFLSLAATPESSQCLDDGPSLDGPQLDFDTLFRALDERLSIDFPAWQTRYNQVNVNDPGPAFGNEDNSQNGIDDDDHLDLLAAVLEGEPVSTVLAGLDASEIAAIRASFAFNRDKVEPDLTFRVLGIVEVSIIGQIEADDIGFADDLKDLVAAYMTLGDAESVSFIRGFLITLSEIFIEKGVDDGVIPAFVEGATKNDMRAAVNGNFVASRYQCYGDAPGTTQMNILGDTGNLDGAGASNETSYAAAFRNRFDWMVAKGIARPTIEILDFTGTTVVSSGASFDLSVTSPGGGEVPLYDWKRLNPVSGQFARVGTDVVLPFAYPLPSDSGDYFVVRCDEHWTRVSGRRTITVVSKPFQIVEQPAGLSLSPGGSGTLTVRVEGGTALPSYQWFRGTEPESLAAISNATDDSYSIANATPAKGGYYQVVAFGADASSVSLSSEIVLVEVSDAPPLINLIGENPLSENCQSVFIDPGVMISDDVDGDISENVQVSGVVDTGTPGAYVLTYTVTDSGGNMASAARTVIVSDTLPPALTLAGSNPQLVECKALYVENGASAFDACDGNLTGSVIASGNVDTSSPGTYTRTYAVTDRAGNTAQATRMVTVVDRVPPVVNLIGPSASTIACGAAYENPGATAFDNCEGNIGGRLTLSGSVDTSAPGIYTLMYTVSDLAGNQAATSRTVTVEDVTPPVITVLGANPLNLACGSVFTDPGATAQDSCAGNLSEGVMVRGTVDVDTPGAYTLTYSVQDTAGNTGTVQRVVNVSDQTPPVLTLLGTNPLRLECGDVFSDPGARAADACDGDLTSVIAVTGTVNSAVPGTYTLTYSVRDGANRTATVLRTVNVMDGTAPVITLNGENPVVLECGSIYVDSGATAADACDGNVSSVIVTSGAVDVGTAGTYPVTYSVLDGAGNSAVVTRTVEVTDTVAPALELLGANPLMVACGGVASDPGARALDTCAGDLSPAVTRTGIVDTTTPGTYTWTYTVADGAQNTATQTRTVEVTDNEAPDLALSGANPLIVACGSAYIDPGATAVDACAGDLSGDIVANGAVNAAVPGEYTVTYSVADVTGNEAVLSRTVVVRDTTAPVLRLNGDETMLLDCGAAWVDPGATADDACDGVLSEAVTVVGTVNVAVPGRYTLRYSAVDANGNIGRATRVVEVAFNCPLTITIQPRDAVVYVGQSQRFWVRTVGGRGALSYTWTRNGNTVQSGENPFLFLENISGADTGDYVCIVSDGMEEVRSEPAALRAVVPASEGFHAADSDGDWVIALGELLRVVQLYNLGGVRCEESTEDGFGGGSGNKDCAPHSTDYNPQDWEISVTEILRLIQFYNVPNGTYHAEDGTEDGYQVGPG